MEYVPNPDIVSTQLDNGETVLLHLRARGYYSINETGSVIRNGLTEGKSLDEIVTDVIAAFEVAEAIARENVGTFLQQLVQDGIVSSR